MTARSESIVHVVFRHDRAGKPDCFEPYHIDPLCRYCARPPGNPAFKLLGIYPSERAARAAMDADLEYVRASFAWVNAKIDAMIERFVSLPPPKLTEEERAQLRALNKRGRGPR